MRRSHQQLGEREDSRQRIVQLVRHSAHQLTDRCQLFALHQLFSQPPLIGYIPDDAEGAHHHPLIGERSEGEGANA